MESKLVSKGLDGKKQTEILSLTRSALVTILDSFGQNELLPKREPSSANELAKHISEVTEKAKKMLLSKMTSYSF
jgi:DNA-binding MarR family transcriptional regulator